VQRLADYAPPDFLVDTVDLTFDLDPERTVVASRLTLRRAAGGSEGCDLRLDGRDLELVSIALDGAPVSANRLSVDPEGLTLAAPPDAFILEIVTAIAPRKNTTRNGLFELQGKLATQCEPEGFRRITFFPDRPDVLARYAVTLRADPKTYPVLLSNGDRTGEGDMPDGRRWAAWHDPWPKPSYIFAVIAGDFACLADSFVTAGGRSVALGIWSDANLTADCRFAMECAKRALAWDEAAYGLEYDLDVFNIVALSGWSGAMENKGLNLFGASGVVADPAITTDEDLIVLERIIGHEIFHNWTGNRVTCRDWFQLCLKEGLTRFRDQQFIEEKLGGGGVWRIEGVKALRRNQFPEDDGPAAHPVKPAAYAEIENFYTNTVYDKGAEVVRMLRALLGPAKFREAVRLYLARHDGEAATTEAFIAAMEEVSGRDLTQFALWHSQAGRPLVRARGEFDAQARTYRLTLTQSCRPTPGQAEKAPFHIPVALGLLSDDGRSLASSLDGGPPAADHVVELREAEQTFVFEGVPSPPTPSLLRGFSAPVSLDASLGENELLVLTRADPDPFCRWDAAQTLAVRLIRRLAADRRAGRAFAGEDAFVEAVGAVLDDEACDRLLRAQILGLPDEPVLSEGLPLIDLDGHIAARDHLRCAIARRLKDRLLAQYHTRHDAGGDADDISAIGRRRLANTALDLLTALDEPEIADLCLAQLREATNMTDQFEALALLAHLDCPQREAAVAEFYDRWKHRPTVIDKWFNAQALSRAPGAVDRIIALERHEAFDPRNFSQGLAYYGGFFRQNRVAFHDPSGKGYDFLAERLLALDAQGRSGGHYLMPQINQWRRYDPHRRSLMEAALRRVADTPGLSRGLAENVERALT
jgi:aminopeptidase N